jgi:hypothetical protein
LHLGYVSASAVTTVELAATWDMFLLGLLLALVAICEMFLLICFYSWDVFACLWSSQNLSAPGVCYCQGSQPLQLLPSEEKVDAK